MKPLQPNEVSYIIEARIRGISVQELLAGKKAPDVIQEVANGEAISASHKIELALPSETPEVVKPVKVKKPRANKKTPKLDV